MSDTWFFFIFLVVVPFAVGMIYVHISQSNYDRGVRDGYHKGRAVNRQEFWSE